MATLLGKELDSFDDFVDALVDEPVHVHRSSSKLSVIPVAASADSDGEDSSSSYSLPHMGGSEPRMSSSSSSSVPVTTTDFASGVDDKPFAVAESLPKPPASSSTTAAAVTDASMMRSSSWQSTMTTVESGTSSPGSLAPSPLPPHSGATENSSSSSSSSGITTNSSNSTAASHNSSSSSSSSVEPGNKVLLRNDSMVPVAEDKKGHTVYKFGKLVSLNDYSIGRVIGKGGFAEVKLGTKGDVKYAIKVIDIDVVMNKFMLGARAKGAALTEQMGRVTAEIEIMKTLRHPHLVQLFEVLRDDKNIYLIMEYMEGGPIMSYNTATHRFRCNVPRALLGNARGQMSEEWACKEFASLISGLRYLHERHIAHRDLKPENLLIDSRGVLKVSDFGVSRHFVEERKKDKISLKQLAKSQSRGKVTNTEGTWVFYSPEMCQETSSTYSAYMADIWAAGVCLWVFVFNVLPFFHPEVRALFRDIRERDPCETMPHAVSPELNDLFRKILAKDVDTRLSIDDIERHPWMVKEAHAPMHGADSVLEEGDEDAEDSDDSDTDSFSKGFSTNFTEAFCTMASTVYQNHGASNKNVLQGAASAGGSVGSHKGSFSRAGSSRNVRSSPNPNSPNTAAAAVTSVAASSAIGGGGGLGSMSFDMADEIVEDPEESSDYESGEEGGRDESSYESEVNDEFTSEWSPISPNRHAAGVLPTPPPAVAAVVTVAAVASSVGAEGSGAASVTTTDAGKSSPRADVKEEEEEDVVSTEAVELLEQSDPITEDAGAAAAAATTATAEADAAVEDIEIELAESPKPAACCTIS